VTNWEVICNDSQLCRMSVVRKCFGVLWLLFRVLARVCAYDFCFVLNYIGRPEGDRGFP